MEIFQTKSLQQGITLIEVLVSLVILSVFLGLGSQLVRSGVQASIQNTETHKWLHLIESTYQHQELLPKQETTYQRSEQFPFFKNGDKPKDLFLLSIKWEKNDQKINVGFIQAQTTIGKKIEWRIYQE
ncbi:MAG: prepilin-type N-terminal cleavage/methylation domain-containing protein [bacterium]|jgi:prepilin-type N-terminal cleavage/methylation domain-containing protein